MIKPELYSVLRRLELKTKRLISGPLLSDFRSKKKGTGFHFHQLRDYQQGDDIRYIDWKSSARTQKLLVKEFLEDKNRVIYIAIDCSASLSYGSSDSLKEKVAHELASILAFLGLHSKDSVGLLLFTDEIELILKPNADRAHILALVQTILTFRPKGKKTNIDKVLQFLGQLKNNNILIYLISDFTAPFTFSRLKGLTKRFEFIVFRCLDKTELTFPNVGILDIQDIETNQIVSLKTEVISHALNNWNREQEKIFKKYAIDALDIITNKPYFSDLVRFLNRRRS